MNTDRILTETFHTHEHLTPDAETAFGAVQHQIRSRRRRRVGGLAAGGAAAAVTAVVLSAALVGGQIVGGQRAPTNPPATPPAREQPVNLPLLRIGSTWLPPGSREITARVEGQMQTRTFETRSDGLGRVGVMLTLLPVAEGLPATDGDRVPHDLTVNGWRAREWSVDDFYLIGVQMPDRQVVMVHVEGGRNYDRGRDGSAAALAVIGRRVAAGLVLDRHEPMATTFTLAHLPPGLVVRRAVGPRNTAFVLAEPGVGYLTNGMRAVEVNEYGGSAQQLIHDPLVNGRKLRLVPIPPVDGARAYLLAGGTSPTMVVDSIRPGMSVMIGLSRAGVVSTAEMRRIAEGIRLR